MYKNRGFEECLGKVKMERKQNKVIRFTIREEIIECGYWIDEEKKDIQYVIMR